MRYISALDVWDYGISQALLNGQLKLQVGQWLMCGKHNEHKCRFVRCNGVTIDVVHWEGSSKATNDKFLMRISGYKRGKV